MKERIYTRDAQVGDTDEVIHLYDEYTQSRGTRPVSPDSIAKIIESPDWEQFNVAVDDNDEVRGAALLSQSPLSLSSGRGGIVEELIVTEHDRGGEHEVNHQLLADLSRRALLIAGDNPHRAFLQLSPFRCLNGLEPSDYAQLGFENRKSGFRLRGERLKTLARGTLSVPDISMTIALDASRELVNA